MFYIVNWSGTTKAYHTFTKKLPSLCTHCGTNHCQLNTHTMGNCTQTGLRDNIGVRSRVHIHLSMHNSKEDKLRMPGDAYQAKYPEARLVEAHQYPWHQGLGATWGSQSNWTIQFTPACLGTQSGVPGVDPEQPGLPVGVESDTVGRAPKDGESRNKKERAGRDP